MLSPEIRRQICGEPMRSFIRSFSSVAVKPDMPQKLLDLLDRLDDAEEAAKRGRRNGNSHA